MHIYMCNQYAILFDILLVLLMQTLLVCFLTYGHISSYCIIASNYSPKNFEPDTNTTWHLNSSD